MGKISKRNSQIEIPIFLLTQSGFNNYFMREFPEKLLKSLFKTRVVSLIKPRRIAQKTGVHCFFNSSALPAPGGN